MKCDSPASVKAVWAAVLKRAIDDLKRKKFNSVKMQESHDGHKDKSITWLNSVRTTEGSFIWICEEVLNLNTDNTRRVILEG